MELLRSIGVIPTPEQVYANTQPPTVACVNEEDEVKAVMFDLVNAAYERAKIFSQPLPSLEEDESEATVDVPPVPEENE